LAAWPKYKEEVLIQDTIQLVVQVNGKLRSRILVRRDIHEKALKDLVIADETVAKFVNDKPIKKFIYVPGKLANVVI